MFDPNAFLNTVYNEQTSTKSIVCPAGDYAGVISKLAARSIVTGDGDTRFLLDVTFDVQDPNGAIKAVTKRDKNTARMSVWLDMTDSGQLDMSEGANVQLGRLREAVGQNGPGTWMAHNLMGAACRISVKVRTTDKGDFADVSQVAPF